MWLQSVVIEMLLDDGEEIEVYDGADDASLQPDNVSTGRNILVHWLLHSQIML